MVVSKRPVLSIQEIKAAVRPGLKAAGVLKAILYGSYSRGEADAYSDVDLIVVCNTKRPFVSRFEELLPLLTGLSHPVELLVYTPQEMERMMEEGNPFLERALAEGIVVYEAQ